MFPNFVADHDQVIGNSDLCDDFQFGPVEQPPGRVMGVVDDDGTSRWCDRSGQDVALDPPSRRAQRYLAHHAPSAADERCIGVIGGRHHDDFVTRGDRRQQCRRNRLGRAARHADILCRQ